MGRRRSQRAGRGTGKAGRKRGSTSTRRGSTAAAEKAGFEPGSHLELAAEKAGDGVRVFPEIPDVNEPIPGPAPELNGEATLSLLEAEANAAIAAAPAELAPGEPGAELGPTPEQSAEEWRVVTKGVVTGTALVILPQWNLSAEEQGELSESLALCMAQIFPGGINGKYSCWIRLIAASTAIVGGRFIAGGGKLPPIGPRIEKPAPIAEHGPAREAA